MGDYEIKASEVPSAWRPNSTASSFSVASLVDSYGPFPVSTNETLDSKWKHSGSNAFGSYQKVVSSEYYQETIEGLRYNHTEFLALWGTTPGLYYSPDGTIPLDYNVPAGSYSPGDTSSGAKPYYAFNTKYVNCIWAHADGYPSASSVTPYWFYMPWLAAQMSYYRQRGEKQNVLYTESDGKGLLWTFVNEESNSTNHYFYIWRAGNSISVKENRPIKSKDQYYDEPTTYSGRSMFLDRGARPWQGTPFVVNILIAAGGAGGSGSGVGNNGDSGGSGAVGIFQVDLSQTTASSPLRITLGGPGSASKSGQHSYIQFYWSGTSSANAQGWRIGGGRCNSESDAYGQCGKLSQPWGTGDSVIKKIWSCDGKSWNNNMPATNFTYGNQVFYFRGGSAGSDGGGAGSLFGDGGARHTGWINNGDSAHYIVGAGGGGGCGGGSGGEGGMSWMAIFY